MHPRQPELATIHNGLQFCYLDCTALTFRAGLGKDMAENKTKPTGASVEDYIASRANEQQRKDCKELIAMLRKITKQKPHMWGPSIVGFGTWRYKTASGRSGETPMAAFAIRGRDLVMYLYWEDPNQKALLAKLGKHSMGKSCLYFRQLADLDKSVLEQLVVSSIAEAKQVDG